MDKVLIETSARHVHLTKEDFEVLFGVGKELTVKKELSQPGQFASEERVDIVGPKKAIKGVTILGPFRSATQVEVSLTDARTLGINAPVRESGYIDGTPGCKIVGPCGEIDIEKGVIAAKRHIHVTPDDAKKMGLADKQIVSVKVEGTGRAILMGDVVIRVNSNFATAMHIDTDEANAGAIPMNATGTIVK